MPCLILEAYKREAPVSVGSSLDEELGRHIWVTPEENPSGNPVGL